MFQKEVATETSRRSCFRTPFGNQRVNEFQTPLKVARHHCYPFFPWIPGKVSWKKTALLWSLILRLFANALTADDKYSFRNMQNFLQQLQMLLSENWKTLSGFFIEILKCAWNLKYFEKKDESPRTNYFRNYCFGKSLLLKRLECFSSEHHSVINVLRSSKHRWKLQGTTIILFPHEFQVKWVEKRLLYSDQKS